MLAAPVGDLPPADFWREWGYQLLPPEDRAFSSPEYLKLLRALAAPQTTSFYAPNSRHYTDATAIYETFAFYFAQTDTLNRIRPLRFANSGTEANNLLFEMAEIAYRQRTGLEARRVHLLYLGDPFGGNFGRIAEFGKVYEPRYIDQIHLKVPIAPRRFDGKPSSDDRFLEDEDLSLQFIENAINHSRYEIGGIFLEAISATPRLTGFRPQYLRRLRKLADRLRVPIFVDEVLTGGGRTGKFWAYQHYLGFEPDLFTFGKGLVVSGVAEMKRVGLPWRWPDCGRLLSIADQRYPSVMVGGTSRAHPLVLAQSTQVMKRVINDDLSGQAERVGRYARKLLRAKFRQFKLDSDVVGAAGMLIDVGDNSFSERVNVHSFYGRWMPPLTTTEEDFDRLLKSRRRKYREPGLE